MSRSFKLARGLLGQVVTVTINRPMGSSHPKRGYVYPVNYGYVSGVIAPDSDGRFAVQSDGVSLPFRTLDKVQTIQPGTGIAALAPATR